MGVKVTVDHKVRVTRGSRTFRQKARTSHTYTTSSKPVGYSQMVFTG
jgi:hypothetical protein